MPKMLWECPGCDKQVRSDPLGTDDWGGEEVAVGPDCEECDLEMEAVPPHWDPDHEHNSAKHHTGAQCVKRGCTQPAGTAWSPYWCWWHNAERMDRITRHMEEILRSMRAKQGERNE